MAEEKWEEIELVKDENGIVPHEALIIALHYHWQEAGGEEDIHGLIDRLHTHGALDHYEEMPHRGNPVLGNEKLVKYVDGIIHRLERYRLDREEASRRFMELSRLCSKSLNNDEQLSYELQYIHALVANLPVMRGEAADELVRLSQYGSGDNWGKGPKEKVKNPAVTKAC